MAKDKSQLINDGLSDVIKGYGTQKDILTTAKAKVNYLTQSYSQLQALYRSNSWARRICEVFASYTTKSWRYFEEENKENLKILTDYEKNIQLKQKAYEALLWSHLYGGALIVAILDDGEDTDKPLVNIKANGLKKLLVFDASQAMKGTMTNDDFLSPNFGGYEIYQVKSGTKFYNFHHSRCYRMINGMITSDLQANTVFGISTIEPIKDTLTSDDIISTAVANLVDKATLDIIKSDDLVGYMARGQNDIVTQRLRYNDIAKSMFNTMIMGGQEDYIRITQSFGGLPELTTKSLEKISAVSEIPATILLGKSPDGMNATGVSDLAIFQERISTEQEMKLTNFLNWVDDIQAKTMGQETLAEWFYNDIFTMTEMQEAELRNKNVDSLGKLQAIGADAKTLSSKAYEWKLINADEINQFESALGDLEMPLESEIPIGAEE